MNPVTISLISFAPKLTTSQVLFVQTIYETEYLMPLSIHFCDISYTNFLLFF